MLLRGAEPHRATGEHDVDDGVRMELVQRDELYEVVRVGRVDEGEDVFLISHWSSRGAIEGRTACAVLV
jgi:hypothetical protein